MTLTRLKLYKRSHRPLSENFQPKIRSNKMDMRVAPKVRQYPRVQLMIHLAMKRMNAGKIGATYQIRT